MSADKTYYFGVPQIVHEQAVYRVQASDLEEARKRLEDGECRMWVESTPNEMIETHAADGIHLDGYTTPGERKKEAFSAAKDKIDSLIEQAKAYRDSGTSFPIQDRPADLLTQLRNLQKLIYKYES